VIQQPIGTVVSFRKFLDLLIAGHGFDVYKSTRMRPGLVFVSGRYVTLSEHDYDRLKLCFDNGVRISTLTGGDQ
jgi:hypothetical protein